MCLWYGPYEASKACWFVLTDTNVFMVLKASMMGAASIITVPLRDIDAAIENRGLLLSKLTLTTKGAIYTLHNAQKNDTTAFVTYFNKRKLELLNSETNVSEQPVQNRAGQPDSTSTLSTQDVQQDVQTEGNHSQSVPTMPVPDLTAKDNTSTKAGIAGKAGKKKPGCMTRILQIFLLFIILGAIGSFFDKDSNNKKTIDSPSANSNKKVYEYKILSEEHNKQGGAKRFTYEIAVPLGLSKEELTQLLTNAAWDLQKKKGASGIWIFAYREDDNVRKNGYSAGRCVLAPDGDWAKAISSSSNLKAVIDIAGTYSDNSTPLKKGTKMILKEDAELNDKTLEKVLGTVKKGTGVTILEHRRDFNSYAIMDYYRVRINKSKKEGWLWGYYLTTN